MNEINKEVSQAYAKTTIAYLGGMGRLKAMTGAYNFLIEADNVVSFRFKGSRKANTIKLTLTGDDLYTVEFLKYSPSKMEFKAIKKVEGYYFDMLAPLFEETTGLYLTF